MAITNKFIAATVLAASVVALPATSQAAKETFDRSKNYLNIGVSIGGTDFGDVVSLRGLGISVPATESSKITGTPKLGTLTLKRGYSGDTALQNLVTKAADSGDRCQSCRQEIKITLLSPSGEVLRTFHLNDAFPVNWSLSSEAAANGSAVYEEVEFSYGRVDTQ